MKKLIVSIAFAVALIACAPASAQTPNITGNEFQTGQAGKTVVGTVGMCVNASNVAIPCPYSSTGPGVTANQGAPNLGANQAWPVITDGVYDSVISSATASSAAVGATFSTAGYGSMSFQVVANASANTAVIEGSDDGGTTWNAVTLRSLSNNNSIGGQGNSLTSGLWSPTAVLPQMRWRVSTFVGGTTTIAVGLKRSQSPNTVDAFVGNTVTTAPASSGDIIVTPSANFTRPANTTAYVVGQLVANSVTAGSVTPMSWTATRVAAGNAYVRRVRMTLSSKSITNTSFVLHLYTVTPTIANGDGATWLTTLANQFCDINITVTDVGSDVSQGIGVPASGSECNFVAGGVTIFGLLSAAAAYTPASAEVITVVPEIHQN